MLVGRTGVELGTACVFVGTLVAVFAIGAVLLGGSRVAGGVVDFSVGVVVDKIVGIRVTASVAVTSGDNSISHASTPVIPSL